MVTNLIGMARQTAMSKNTMSALVLLADQGTPDDYRALRAGIRAGVGWQQVSNWETFPPALLWISRLIRRARLC
jgi:hypothetical protein